MNLSAKIDLIMENAVVEMLEETRVNRIVARNAAKTTKAAAKREAGQELAGEVHANTPVNVMTNDPSTILGSGAKPVIPGHPLASKVIAALGDLPPRTIQRPFVSNAANLPAAQPSGPGAPKPTVTPPTEITKGPKKGGITLADILLGLGVGAGAVGLNNYTQGEDLI